MGNIVTIKNIIIEGFRSYCKPVTFTFNKTGLHLIKGNNGEGKTTLFSALSWCLYKVNLNDTNNDKVVTYKWMRGDSWRGTRVQVTMTVGKYRYLIARHIKFKAMTRGIEGEDAVLIFRKPVTDKEKFTVSDIVNDPLYKEDAQAYINKLLGIDSKTFLNSILFGQRMSRLMESKDADKRSLFERLFDVDFIDQLKDKASAKQTTKQSELQQAESQLQIHTNKLQDLQSRIAESTQLLQEFAERRKSALKQIRIDYDNTKEAYDRATSMVEKLTKPDKSGISIKEYAEAEIEAQKAYTDAKIALQNTDRGRDELSKDIAKLDREIEGQWANIKSVKTVCPVCGGKLKPEDVTKAKKAIEEQISVLVESRRQRESGLTAYNNKHDVLTAQLKNNLAVYEKALDTHNKAKQNRSSADELGEWKSEKAACLAKLQLMKKAYDTEKAKQPPTINLEALKGQENILSAEIEQLNVVIAKKQKYLQRLAWWQKAFGANGLKMYIFSASLNRLNQCIAAYASYFNMQIIFGIDLNKASKPFYTKVIMDGKNAVDYDELSGGEKGRIDLCINFGVQDANEINATFNIRILDEPEVNLDGETLETLDTLLRIQAESKAVYVISHNSRMDLAGATVFEVSNSDVSSTIE